ncbi:cell division protein FtsI (penicillin-binding protein 3) [Mucilaginibacter gracilis]|uniref:Cell division protein FtsI (Penicillin-binding protein 3) n=1 Tax=Mucilaginibacter gracilis TaxID=423350 RepID=A0A495JAS9_9SPHI|nr:penicillin-binding protein [Mucilaginibacter gracilis]RKR85462.1 cell division protein FtsI (penicillin-binding protein 3) [Mucilaginibacter gracilis]
MSIRTNILLRVYLAFGLIMVFALAVAVQLCRVQFVQGKKWCAMADSLSTRYVKVEAARGNIFSSDGSLLATSIPEYELHMDLLAGGIADDDTFLEKIDSLALKMSQFFGDKSASEYSRLFKDARKDSSRYELIRRNVTYQQLKQVRKFPIFNMGKYKGGLIVVQKNKRILPFKSLAARTIGYTNENVSNVVGLEGAYANYINGESGQRLMQHVAGGIWIPVNNGNDEEVEPKEGADIISTIDVNFQDVAQKALEKQLIKSDADHGVVILMEVQTGEVRAVANYTKVAPRVYKEKFNYAIAGNQDPGSTFKLASYMALIEDHKVDTSTRVNTGTYQIPGHLIKDSHGSIGVVSVKRAFEESSNSAIAYLVNNAYHNDQSQFTDHLYDWHLNEKMGLQIPGEARPVIKNPKNTSWNKKMTLPQMAYGYEMQLTPLKMLSFYNAVANNGKYISPVFVREIKRMGNTIERFQTHVINPKICSDRTLKIMQELLEGVVSEGTGKSIINNPLYKIAGKTGTAQVADANKGYKAKKQYQASFCGYFPADHPKYSLIVVINDPKGGYYAAKVAGPPFREIADKVYSSDLDMNQSTPMRYVGNTRPAKIKTGDRKAIQQVYSKLGIKPLYASNNPVTDTSNGVVADDVRYRKGLVPSVTGMGLSDALYTLGNAGYKVNVRGSGVVARQSVTGGSIIPKGSKIQIELE